jgi:hypothetical protein
MSLYFLWEQSCKLFLVDCLGEFLVLINRKHSSSSLDDRCHVVFFKNTFLLYPLFTHVLSHISSPPLSHLPFLPFLMFHTPTEIFKIANQKMSKTSFFKWQPQFATLDINVNLIPNLLLLTFCTYAYSQPCLRNFDFLSKIFFFFQTVVLFEFLFKNHMQ